MLKFTYILTFQIVSVKVPYPGYSKTKKARVQLDPVKRNPKNKCGDLKGLKLVPTLYFKNVGLESIKSSNVVIYLKRMCMILYFGCWAFSLMFFVIFFFCNIKKEPCTKNYEGSRLLKAIELLSWNDLFLPT
jgi:hypothetical protein